MIDTAREREVERIAAINRAAGDWVEVLDNPLDRLGEEPVEEAGYDRRWPKGTAKAGQFRPRRGGSPGIRKPVERALRGLVPRLPESPATGRHKQRGEWRWAGGRRVFVPEHRQFRRRIGGSTYTSPPGSTALSRDGKPTTDHAERGKPGALLGPASSFTTDAAGRLRAAPGQLALTEPGDRALSTKSPQSWEAFAADTAALIDTLGREHNAAVQHGEIIYDESKFDAAGGNDWQGNIRLGRDTRPTIRYRLPVVANPTSWDLIDSDKQDRYAASVYNLYRVQAHEASHSVNPANMEQYTALGGDLLEEGLTEEVGHVLAVENLRRHGLGNVVAWADAHPDADEVRGTYRHFRSAIRRTFDDLGIPQERWGDLTFGLKFDVSPGDRLQTMIDERAGEDPKRGWLTWPPTRDEVRARLLTYAEDPEDTPLAFVKRTPPAPPPAPFPPDARVMYHVTGVRNRASIADSGLRIPEQGSPFVWLVDDLGVAQKMARQSWGGSRGDNVILAVDTKGMDLKPDPHPGGQEGILRGHAFVASEPIPPERVRAAEPASEPDAFPGQPLELADPGTLDRVTDERVPSSIEEYAAKVAKANVATNQFSRERAERSVDALGVPEDKREKFIAMLSPSEQTMREEGLANLRRAEHTNWTQRQHKWAEDAEDARNKLAHAVQEADRSPIFKRFQDRYGPSVYMVAEPEPGDLATMGQRQGVRTIFTDMALRHTRITAPQFPGMGSAQGMTGMIRHEYAHEVYDRLTPEQRRAFIDGLPHRDFTRWYRDRGVETDGASRPTVSTIQSGLSYYAAQSLRERLDRRDNTAIMSVLEPEDYDEVFAETFAVATDPDYDASKWPTWMNKQVDLVRGLAGPKGEADPGAGLVPTLFHVAPEADVAAIEREGLTPRGKRLGTYPEFGVIPGAVYAYPGPQAAKYWAEGLKRDDAIYKVEGIPWSRLAPDHEDLNDVLNQHFNFSSPSDTRLGDALAKIDVDGTPLPEWWRARVPRAESVQVSAMAAEAVADMPPDAREAAARVMRSFDQRVAVMGTISPEHLVRVPGRFDPGTGGPNGYDTGTFFHVATAERAKAILADGFARPRRDGEKGTFGYPVAPDAVYMWPTEKAAQDWIKYRRSRGEKADMEIVPVHADTSQLEPDPEPLEQMIGLAYADRGRPPRQAENWPGYGVLDDARFYPDPVNQPEGQTLRQWLEAEDVRPWYAGFGPTDETPEDVRKDPWVRARAVVDRMPVQLRRDVARAFAERGQAVVSRGNRPVVERADPGTAISAREAVGIPADATIKDDTLNALLRDGRYELTKLSEDDSNYGKRVTVEVAPRPTPGVETYHYERFGEPRKLMYDTNIATLDPDVTNGELPEFPTPKATLKPDSGYVDYMGTWGEDPPVTPDQPGVIYRGVSKREWDAIRASGEVRSNGTYNIGGAQDQGRTYYDDTFRKAYSYATGFAPSNLHPTFEEPGYVVGVKRPSEDRIIETDGLGIAGPVPASEITGVWEARPYEIAPGKIDVGEASVWGHYFEGDADAWISGSRSGTSERYGVRELAPSEYRDAPVERASPVVGDVHEEGLSSVATRVRRADELFRTYNSLPLTPEEHDAQLAWTGTGYGDINRALRSDRVPPQAHVLDAMLARRPLDAPITVTRMLRDEAEFPDIAPGKLYHEKGYTATSVDGSFIKVGGEDSMTLEVPAGVPAFYVGGFDNEGELTLGRGLNIQIDSVTDMGSSSNVATDRRRSIRAHVVGVAPSPVGAVVQLDPDDYDNEDELQDAAAAAIRNMAVSDVVALPLGSAVQRVGPTEYHVRAADDSPPSIIAPNQHAVFDEDEAAMDAAHELVHLEHVSLAGQQVHDAARFYHGFEFLGHEGGRFRAEVDEADSVAMTANSGGAATFITGSIRRDGKAVGTFTRHIEPDENGVMVVHHDLLKLSEDAQGEGFASAFNRQAEIKYRRAGISRIELETAWVGGFAWARAGYSFQDWPTAKRAVRRPTNELGGEARRTLGMLHDGPLPDGIVEDIVALDQGIGSDQLNSEASIAQFGIEHAWTVVNETWVGPDEDVRVHKGEKLWVGKLALLGTGWSGYKRLTPAATGGQPQVAEAAAEDNEREAQIVGEVFDEFEGRMHVTPDRIDADPEEEFWRKVRGRLGEAQEPGASPR